mgnify:CR=1 FL=1
MKKRLLVARVYLDNIHYLDRISFHRKMFKAIKEALEEQYEHRLTVDKRTLIAHILTMKFCKDYHIELLLSEYNNLNFLLSIEDNCKYKIFDVQDEGYFIHKNEFNTKIMKHISASERWCGRWDLNPQGSNIHRSLRPARLPVPPHPHIKLSVTQCINLCCVNSNIYF